MPTGVQVTIGAAAGSGGGDPTLEAQFFVIGTSQRGSTTEPIIAKSYTEFTDKVGPRTTTGSAHDAVRAYFAENEGTGRIVFGRAVGPGAVSKGTLTLQDLAATALDTLRIDAASVGMWSANVTVEVTDGALADTFTLTIRNNGNVVEAYSNLTSPAAAVAALASSDYVRAVNLGSATVAPGNNPKPLSPTALSAGADDVQSVGYGELVGVLDMFSPDLGPGIIAIPGQPQGVVTNLAAHCLANNRVGVVAAAAGTTPSSASDLVRALRSTNGARNVAMIYPWIVLPADGEAGVRTVPPEGAYAGRRAAAIGRVGVWQPPAGEYGAFSYVLAPEVVVTAAQRDALVDDAVIPIVASPTPRIYGARSLSAEETTWRFLSYSDLANLIAYHARQVMDGYIGRSIDGLRGKFFVEMRNDLASVMQPYADGGGLVPGTDSSGQQTDPGFVIDLSANTGASVMAGQAIADISFRPPSVAELIRIRLTKTGLTPVAA